MKKSSAFVAFALIMCLSLVGCKSQAVTSTEKQIKGIGEVSIERSVQMSREQFLIIRLCLMRGIPSRALLWIAFRVQLKLAIMMKATK